MKLGKKTSLSLLVSAAMLLFIACNHQTKEEKERLDEKVEVEIDSIQTAASEWEAYRAKINSKIAENDLKIQEIENNLKGNKGVVDKVRQNRIDALKEKNQKLREKLDSWTSDYSKWEEFKKEVDKSMDELDASVRDFLKE